MSASCARWHRFGRSVAYALALSSIIEESALAQGVSNEPAAPPSSAAAINPAPRLSPWGYDFAATALIAKPFETAPSLGDWGYGVSLSGGVHWQDFPLSSGFDLAGIRWGQATSIFEVRLGDSTQPLRETRTDQTILIGGWLRLQPTAWCVRPYLEGALGIKLLDTRYSFALVDGKGTTSAVTDQATAFSAGFGLGVDVLLARATDGSPAGVFATLAIRRLWGSNAAFTRAPDASSANRIVAFDIPTSTTLVSLGIALHGQVLGK